jgi:DNA-binding SARP family transcriptional activator
MHGERPVMPKLVFFGTPHLLDGEGRKIELPSKAYLLVLYLCLSGKSAEAKRLQVARFLWPDQANAAVNLRQLLLRLRSLQQQVGVEFLTSDTADLKLIPSAASTDIDEFKTLVRQLDWTNAQKLIEIYAGDLLSGIDAADGETFAWLDRQRDSFRSAFVGAIAKLIDGPDIQKNVQTAETLSSKLLEIDPGQEIAYRALMTCHAAARRLDRVAATFERCKAVLLQEFGIAPSSETSDLYARLIRPQAASIVSTPAPLAKAPARSTTTSLPRLVVLMPSQGRSQNAAIATALIDDVIINLCSLQSIAIVAPHTSWKLSKGAWSDTIFEEFEIDYIAETNLFEINGDVKLNVKLIDRRGRTIVWADSLALSIENSAACFRGLALGLALSISNAVEEAELGRFEAEHNATAYYLHLVGQKHLRNLALPDVRRAKKAFRQSIAVDPEFSPSRAGQARAIQREWLLLGRGDAELLDEAATSAQHAIDLDYRDARGYRELGFCNIYRRRWDDGIAFFTEAERRNPQYADLLADFGDALAHAGNPEAGLVKIQRAIELNPIPPEKYWWDIAGIYFQLRLYQEAISAIERMDNPTSGLRIAAASWAYLGDKAKAKLCVTEFLESYPGFDVSSWLAIVPNRNPDDTQHYEAGLRLAGF